MTKCKAFREDAITLNAMGWFCNYNEIFLKYVASSKYSKSDNGSKWGQWNVKILGTPKIVYSVNKLKRKSKNAKCYYRGKSCYAIQLKSVMRVSFRKENSSFLWDFLAQQIFLQF